MISTIRGNPCYAYFVGSPRFLVKLGEPDHYILNVQSWADRFCIWLGIECVQCTLLRKYMRMHPHVLALLQAGFSLHTAI